MVSWRRILLVAGLAVLLVRGALAAPSLDDRVRQIDRNAAQRFLTLGTTAARAKHGEVAVHAFQRVLDLDAENTTARREMGYRKGPGGWKQEKAPDVGPPPTSKEEEDRQTKFLAQMKEIEEWRAREIVKACAEAGDRDAARPHLLRLLERLPRMEALHSALGHEKVGGRYVRPDLLPLAKAAVERVKVWALCREPATAAEPTEETLAVPGKGEWPVFRVGTRRIGAAFPKEDAVAAARGTECSHKFARDLWGDDVKSWDPPLLHFLDPLAYAEFLKGRHPDAEEVKRRLGSASYGAKDVFLLRAVVKSAMDIYAHNVGYRTAKLRSAPPRPEGMPRDAVDDHYAWFNEGVGYFFSLELFDSAGTSFFSTEESNRKISGIPAPKVQNAETLGAWVRVRRLAGEGHDLRDLLSRSINNLDFHMSMEAWTFVRFLALYDAEAFQRLPSALAAQAHGPEAERSDAALRSAYGKAIEDLEPLWRIYVLEVL